MLSFESTSVLNSIYKRNVLGATVFLCGALVMIFEIIGSRILSPFIGTSTYVWTSLIGVILGALSVGYWLGGRVADKRPDVKVLAAVIFAAGGLVSLTILVKEVVLSMIASATTGLEVKSLLAALILFAPASVCLGFVTPFAVRLKLTDVQHTGRTVGHLYALSTIGSIAGTFAAGFLLIPFVGSVRTLYFIAGSLFLLSLGLAPLSFTRVNFAAITLFLLGIGSTEVTAYIQRERSGLHDIDTEYSRVQVFETTDPVSGRPIRALATDPYFVQSATFLENDGLVLQYSHYYHLLRHFRPDFELVLMIGGAGYSFPKEYLRTYESARMDVVEIDPRMTDIARRSFRLTDNPRLSIFHEDGRMLINRADSDRYDAVLMDAFGSLFTVPTHLTTLEAVTQIHRILKEDGIVIFNLGSAISGPGSRFFQAEYTTYRSVFPNVYLFKVRPDYADEKLQNLIIVAAKGKLADSRASSDPFIQGLLAHRYAHDIPATASVLTDDLAPVEYFNSAAQNLYISDR